MRSVSWLDLTTDETTTRGPVIERHQLHVSDVYAGTEDGTNIIYDEETDTVFTLLGDPWPPTRAVAETLEQYEPGEL